VELDHGSPERYALPVAYLAGDEASEFAKWHAEGVVADLRSGGVDGVLLDATYSPDYVHAMADLLARRRSLPGTNGRLVGLSTSALRDFDDCIAENCAITTLSAEQSNSSVLLGDTAIFKFIRRFEEGINPEVEIGRFLTEQAHYPNSPRVGGNIEYHSNAYISTPATVAILEEFIPHEEDGWGYVVDALTHGLEEAVAHHNDPELDVTPPHSLLRLDPEKLGPGHLLVGAHLEWATLLGQRTAELHAELTSDPRDPAFAPEPMTALDRQSLYHGARSLTRQVFHEVRALDFTSPNVNKVLAHEQEVLERLRRLTTLSSDASKIRCHGDFHLGQVLWTGKDFAIIDFEGEPFRSLSRRRLKRPAMVDLAGMIRSLHYASRAAALRLTRDLGISMQDGELVKLDTWLTFWHRWVSGTFLTSYLATAGRASYLPANRDDLGALLDFFLLEKAVYELSYEANARPTWVDIPARGLLDMLETAP
jgi:maltose alpha-D-glucosyltransferase/alpha-amylase